MPQNYMFQQMRSQLSIPTDTDILEHLHALPPPRQDEAFAVVQAIEREAMAHQQPQPGLVRLLEFLEARGVRRGICTRNFEYV